MISAHKAYNKANKKNGVDATLRKIEDRIYDAAYDGQFKIVVDLSGLPNRETREVIYAKLRDAGYDLSAPHAMQVTISWSEPVFEL